MSFTSSPPKKPGPHRDASTREGDTDQDPCQLEAYRRVIDVLFDPVLLVRGDRIAAVNRRARELLASECADSPARTVFSDAPEKLGNYLRLCSRTRETVPALLHVRTREGEIALRTDGALVEPRTDDRPALIMLRLRPKARSVERFLLLNEKLADLTREIQRRTDVERALREQAEELRRSNADLEDFAYIASHDLKEPLRGINTYAQWLQEEHARELSPEAAKRLDTIQSLAKRMYLLLDSLLEYSRVGRGELLPEEVDLREVVEEALRSMGPRLEDIAVAVELGELPRIRCDRILTAQIFTNLISNAIKYNRAEHKRIHIGSLSSATVFVRDNGIGIPPQHHTQIFRMFKRLHQRHEFGGGAGVGLSIVKKIVERHGGRIWAESSADGSTFYFTLRADPFPAPPLNVERQLPAGSA